MADRVNGLVAGEPNGISSRVISMHQRLSNCKSATFIGVYAPTMSHADDSKDQFYDQVSTAMRMTPMSDRIFLISDFNARVGHDHTVWPDVIGPDGIGNINENGESLLSLCSVNHKHPFLVP